MIIDNHNFFEGFFINGLTFVILTFIFLKYFKSIFPISTPSTRSALAHEPIPRGIGIVFPISFILSNFTFYHSTEINISYLSLLLCCTAIGFYDDLRNINYIKKLISLTFVFTLIIFIEPEILLFKNLNFITSFTISIFFFIFYVLFFNQIDGINGLSSGTFCFFLASLIFLNPFEFSYLGMFINIIGIVFLYFILNLFFTKFFQGDSGAYFLGSVAYLAFQENEKFLFVSLILLFPILGDIIWTTLMRIYFGYNLSQPHKEHLYQKSVTYFKIHLPVTMCHIILQSLLFLIIYFLKLHKHDYVNQIFYLMIFGGFISLFYLYTSYSFNKVK